MIRVRALFQNSILILFLFFAQAHPSASAALCGSVAFDECSVSFIGDGYGTYNTSWTTTEPETYLGGSFDVFLLDLPPSLFKLDASFSGLYIDLASTSSSNPYGGLYLTDGNGRVILPSMSFALGVHTFTVIFDGNISPQLSSHVIPFAQVRAISEQTSMQMQFTVSIIPENPIWMYLIAGAFALYFMWIRRTYVAPW